MPHRTLSYCRTGFEPECAQELQAHASDAGVAGFARTARESGYVRFETDVVFAPPTSALIFSRQSLVEIAQFSALDPRDRLGPVLAALPPGAWSDAWVELPDTSGSEPLTPLARALEAALVGALRKRALLDPSSKRRLHLYLLSATDLLVAQADVATTSPWRSGIPRLRFPREAPSRSTLKLEEAFLVLLSDAEREAWLAPGMTAVDLGASPGGWTYQLVRRSIRVTAVDNGPMDERLMQSGLVEHRREDGFRFRPKKPVDWLVCDMVEQPIRVAGLVAGWLRDGVCRYAMFNLKLPMKKRFLEVQRCLETLGEGAQEPLDARAKQLYHDREEITVFVRRH
ncbi:MAG TPA: 23S rRNA (cytidine(2498)-2'-O)-methyltransferase RlmM [Candidatus Saccharimonadia bacterium]|nr:23S rRNA (cytidine(2498)-2'-O)-methyltransferase RlmM [Candidatus Saccharimonadia bacterium]